MRSKPFLSQPTGAGRFAYYPQSRTQWEIKKLFTTQSQYLLLEFEIQLIRHLLQVIYLTLDSTGVADACCGHQVYYSALHTNLILELYIKHCFQDLLKFFRIS